MERAHLAECLRRACGLPGRGPAATAGGPGPSIVDGGAPGAFQAALVEACEGPGEVFLADPSWGSAERRALAEMTALAGDRPAGGDRPEKGWLMIAGGGSSGVLRFARHDGGTLEAAVEGFRRHFGLDRVRAMGLLPLHHVSGLMALMRCALSGGEYRPASWREIAAGALPEVPGAGEWVVSLVPTQLERLLQAGAGRQWLGRFAVIFVGGGPVWPALMEAAAAARLPLAPGYGMTETAAMAAALTPAEFLAGERSCGRPLPHIRARLSEEGTVRLEGPSLFRGYYPHWRPDGPHDTEDLGSFDAAGRLSVLGRRDAVIITGGEKVAPLEVEAALRRSGQFEDVAVAGVADARWGQRVVAFYPAAGKAPDLNAVGVCLSALAAYKHPKAYVPLDPWPRNAQGKVNRAALAGRAGP